jgi:hypothetical protein
MFRILASVLLLLTAVRPATAQGIASASVSGNSVSLVVSLPGNLGADVSLTFESATGLSLANLGVSARLINPFDPAVFLRLPFGVVTSGLPVMLRIEPPAAGGLSFSGVVRLEIHTHNLNFYAATPLRFYSAPLGGPFRDITTQMGSGSYRARGTTGGFSEFLIVADLRPINSVITGKLNRLEDALEDYEGAMPGSVYDNLSARVAAARAHFGSGETTAAIHDLNEFIDVVVDHQGTDIPNVWRSARDLDNVAGYLRASAMTLRFSLDLKRDLGL